MSCQHGDRFDNFQIVPHLKDGTKRNVRCDEPKKLMHGLGAGSGVVSLGFRAYEWVEEGVLTTATMAFSLFLNRSRAAGDGNKPRSTSAAVGEAERM